MGGMSFLTGLFQNSKTLFLIDCKEAEGRYTGGDVTPVCLPLLRMGNSAYNAKRIEVNHTAKIYDEQSNSKIQNNGSKKQLCPEMAIRAPNRPDNLLL
ncbi:MAG: hypothetical protein C0410_07845 [Anaerolinea sp.]|nr:hypothetical protein [Anaerolinea sp.]